MTRFVVLSTIAYVGSASIVASHRTSSWSGLLTNTGRGLSKLPCDPARMAATTDYGFNGTVWERSGAGAYYTYLRGGQSWLADKYLYFLSGYWRVGDNISSTTVYAYNQNPGQSATSPELQMSGGWVRYDGSAWVDIDLVISCGERPLPLTPSSPSTRTRASTGPICGDGPCWVDWVPPSHGLYDAWM